MRGRIERRTKPFDPDAYGPKRARQAANYTVFIPHLIQDFESSQSLQLAGFISRVESEIKELDSNPQLAPLVHYLLRSESIASSWIEGLRLKPHELLSAEAKQLNGQRVGETAKEVISNIEAMEKAIELASQKEKFTLKDLNLIHETLMRNSSIPQHAGKIRTVQNWIGKTDSILSADYIPAPPEEVPALLTDLIEAINENRLSPLTQAAIVHAQFETIHPYVDGNGRTGRALIHVILRRRGLTKTFITPISIPFAQSRDYYIGGLENFREDKIDDWLTFFANAAHQSTTIANRYLESAQAIHDIWLDKITREIKPRRDAAIWQVIKVLLSQPITDIRRMCLATGLTKNVISNAIAQLEMLGIISLNQAITRNRVWEAKEILELLGTLDTSGR